MSGVHRPERGQRLLLRASVRVFVTKGETTTSEREQAKQIIVRLPEYKIGALLLFLKGIQFKDDLYCEKLVEDYLNDTSPGKHETITLEELAKREEIAL